jgi:hypothetical protein
VIVVITYLLDKFGVIGFGFLWLNVLGALAVIGLSWIIQKLIPSAQIQEEKIAL